MHLWIDPHNPRSLEQVRANERSADAASNVEAQLHEFAEAGRVVVTAGLGIAERLQQWIGLQHLSTGLPMVCALCPTMPLTFAMVKPDDIKGKANDVLIISPIRWAL